MKRSISQYAVHSGEIKHRKTVSLETAASDEVNQLKIASRKTAMPQAFKTLIYIGCMMVMLSCNHKEQVDLLVFNAKVYTVDDQFSVTEAFAVKEGRFVATGKTKDILDKYSSDNQLDMKGAPVYPGFHDAHCHFIGLGQSLQTVNLRGATSFQEILERIAAHYAAYPSEWIVGSGWDQNLWEDKRFPTNEALNRLYPHTPVVLKRIDGHAIVANAEAIRRAGMQVNDATIPDHEALTKNGAFTGIFLENTADRLMKAIPEPSEAELSALILRAEALCVQNGLTSVSDAGLSLPSIQLLDSMQQSGRLSLRIDAWMEPSEANFERFKAPYRTDRLRVGCLKLYMDGALGSRGAWMLAPYSDDPSTSGIHVITDEQFLSYCQRAYDAGLQVATHCIGDAANRRALELYGQVLKGENDLRWRIEHAQIIAPEDFASFRKYSIIPSVQPTHATSDMFWAIDRVGSSRLEGSYAYRKLKDQLGWLPFGTDFPIEEVSPICTFFAAVCRKNGDFLPRNGFQMENAVSREDALRAMTIWAAKASFEEDVNGSIEPGKWADFVILDNDLMTVPEKIIPAIKVLGTYIAGKKINENQDSTMYSNPVLAVSTPDPSVIRVQDGSFYLYCTEDIRNMPIYHSTDLVHWKYVTTAFTNETRPNFEPKGGLWAPDINYINGKYVLYYSMSVWGGIETCGIGVAVSDSPTGPFTDKGALFRSNTIGVTNSIDQFYFEDNGKKYLFWGSFCGIYGIELEDDGLAVKADAEKVRIAGKLTKTFDSQGTEGTCIFKRGKYYYCFGSTGNCCEGANSTYHVVVGRSENLFGPYVNKKGQSMFDNYYELVLQGNSTFAGPGHQAEIITDDNGVDWLIYHSYLRNDPRKGRVLCMDKLIWIDDFPVVEGQEPSLKAEVPFIQTNK